jgi:hypothetical protein
MVSDADRSGLVPSGNPLGVPGAGGRVESSGGAGRAAEGTETAAVEVEVVDGGVAGAAGGGGGFRAGVLGGGGSETSVARG